MNAKEFWKKSGMPDISTEEKIKEKKFSALDMLQFAKKYSILCAREALIYYYTDYDSFDDWWERFTGTEKQDE